MSDLAEFHWRIVYKEDVGEVEKLLDQHLPGLDVDSTDNILKLIFTHLDYALDKSHPREYLIGVFSEELERQKSRVQYKKAVSNLTSVLNDESHLRAISQDLIENLEIHDSSVDEYKRVILALTDSAANIMAIDPEQPDESVGQGRFESGHHAFTRLLAQQIGDRINRSQKSKLIVDIFDALGRNINYENVYGKLRDTGL